MSERDELIGWFRGCDDDRELAAANMLERDGAELARLRAENERLTAALKIESLNGAAIVEIRKVCAEIMGGNLAFVDDDFARCLLSLRRERDGALALLDAETGELIDERDEMESALSAAHVALGGDGEWACRVPSPPPPDSGNLSLDVPVLAAQVLARAEAAAREAVAAWMIEHAFATGHGDTLTDLLAELSWQIAEIKRDAIKWRDTPIPVPPGECPYPVHADHSIKACVDAGDCGCGEDRK